MAAYPPATGAGKTWRKILSALPAQGVEPVVARPTRWRPGPAVWLSDGHRGAVRVRRPVVSHLQEAPWIDDGRHFLHEEFSRHMRLAGDEAAAQAALVITPSQYSRDQVIAAHGVPPERVRVVPHGVDTAVFHPNRRADGADLIRRAGFLRPFVAYVSSVHPRKNLPGLRAALSLLADRGYEHGLVMVLSRAADRPDWAELDREARAPLPGHPGRVLALEGLPETDVAAVMAAADALCAPSFSEGFGLAPLEAMACATPVVVAARGALPEVVGGAGAVVEPDPEAIAAALAEVLTDRPTRDRMAAAGLARAADLSWANAAAGWAAALREVTGRRGG